MTTLLQLSADDLEQKLEEVVQRVVSEQAGDIWLTVEQAAEHLGMSEEALRQMLRRGRVPSHRIGERRIRFSKAELDAGLHSGASETW
jgi:excisionase family DNA binding protein